MSHRINRIASKTLLGLLLTATNSGLALSAQPLPNNLPEAARYAPRENTGSRRLEKASDQQAACTANLVSADPPCVIFNGDFEEPEVISDPLGCTIIKDDIADPVERGLFKPIGYVEILSSWNEVFAGNDYPNSWGAHYPVGSWTIGNNLILGKYLSIPFIADTVSQHRLEWIPAVAVAQLFSYAPRPATGVLVTISPCAGDFRTSTAYTGPINDPTMRAACRKFDDTGNIYFGQRVNISVCPVVSGQTYYLNIIFADPRDGLLSPVESTCDVNHPNFYPGVCDAEFYMRQ